MTPKNKKYEENYTEAQHEKPVQKSTIKINIFKAARGKDTLSIKE